MLCSGEGKAIPRNSYLLKLFEKMPHDAEEERRLIAKRGDAVVEMALKNGVVSFSRGGGLGDVLMCTPFLREFKKRCPSVHVRLFTKFGSLVEGLPFIDHVSDVAHEPKDVIPLLYENDRPTNRHLASLFAERMGFQVQDLTPSCWIDPIVLETVSEKVAFLRRPLVVVQRQASDWTPNKKWPSQSWDELLFKLTEMAFVVEIGAQALGSESYRNYLDMRGKTSLQEMAAFIKLADVFVGPDSGPAHIAAAVKTRAVVIAGGYIHPECITYKTTTVLSSMLPCLSCWLQTPCPKNLMCLGMITPDTVVEEVGKTLPDQVSRLG